MPVYQVGAGSKLTVKARSRVHDTTTVWDAIDGTVEADPATIETTGAKVAVAVDMTKYDAGDFLKKESVKRWMAGRIPTGAPGDADDVGRLVAALYHADVPFLTGETLYLDGGHGIAV